MAWAVGLLLTSFGTFWAGEGAGLSWPGGDLAILGLLVLYWVATMATVVAIGRRRPTPAAEVTPR